MRVATGLAVLLLVLAAAAGWAAPPPELAPFAFLVGEWGGPGTGEPGTGSGAAVFARALQDRVILRTSYSEYPAAPGKPGSRHDDLLVLYVAPGGAVRADYYDSEGHVIRYAVQSPAPGQAMFLSEAGGQPRFRLHYTLLGSGALAGEFAIAPPDAPEAFKPYLTWESRKAAAAAKCRRRWEGRLSRSRLPRQ